MKPEGYLTSITKKKQCKHFKKQNAYTCKCFPFYEMPHQVLHSAMCSPNTQEESLWSRYKNLITLAMPCNLPKFRFVINPKPSPLVLYDA
jgi:hypothetical protein